MTEAAKPRSGWAGARTASAALDRRAVTDVGEWAKALGVSKDACEIVLACEVVDLHVDTFIWTRIFGYDPARWHGTGLFDARFYGHCDIPRFIAGGVTSAFWSITTNPFRSPLGRERAFFRNLAKLRRILDACPETEHVRNMTEFRAARAAGKHAAWIVVQGGNALDNDVDALGRIPDDSVVQITLVHLSTSRLGSTSAPDPLRRSRSTGLTDLGKAYVERCDEARILVDLAHIHPDGFWDAVAVHDPSLPLVVTHTGVAAEKLHWRNIDDDQIVAIARTGGTIGIIYHCPFLGGSFFGDASVERVFAHIAHVVDVAGEDYVSLGSDWDGMICTPRDMATVLELPRLVQVMLDHGWRTERIQKVLGGNALRVMEHIRP
jgi:membrane dipeptidase